MDWTDPNTEEGRSNVTAAVGEEQGSERHGNRLDSSFHDNLSQSTQTVYKAPGARKWAGTRP